MDKVKIIKKSKKLEIKNNQRNLREGKIKQLQLIRG